MERLTPDQIKVAVLHADKKVRDLALRYFGMSCDADATVMPLVTQAYDRYGDEAFENPWILPDLPQTVETVAWILQAIERVEAGSRTKESPFARNLICCLLRAEPTLLQHYSASIQGLRHLGDDSRIMIKNRLSAYAMPYDELWKELFRICEFNSHCEWMPLLENARCLSIVRALARFPEQSSAEVLSILADPSVLPSIHLEQYIIELIGLLRLNAAVPWLMYESNGVTYQTLAMVGTDDVVWELVRGFDEGSWHGRDHMAYLLGDIHTDFSVRAALELAREEGARLILSPEYEDAQASLLTAAVLNFAPCAIEPARQYILGCDSSPTPDLRYYLLLACQIMGKTFPEYESWLEAGGT